MCTIVFLDVIVGYRSAVFKLLSVAHQSLLIPRNFLCLSNHHLHLLHRVPWLGTEEDSLTRQRLDEYLDFVCSFTTFFRLGLSSF